MSTHNIHSRREIRKNNMWTPIWSYAVKQADLSRSGGESQLGYRNRTNSPMPLKRYLLNPTSRYGADID